MPRCVTLFLLRFVKTNKSLRTFYRISSWSNSLSARNVMNYLLVSYPNSDFLDLFILFLLVLIFLKKYGLKSLNSRRREERLSLILTSKELMFLSKKTYKCYKKSSKLSKLKKLKMPLFANNMELSGLERPLLKLTLNTNKLFQSLNKNWTKLVRQIRVLNKSSSLLTLPLLSFQRPELNLLLCFLRLIKPVLIRTPPLLLYLKLSRI